jgi:hypothetical protein
MATNEDAPKGKAEKPAELDPLDSVFSQLERRVEALAQRLKAALEENGKLKTAAAAARRTGRSSGPTWPRRGRPRERGRPAAWRYETEKAEVRADRASHRLLEGA